jgi:hypothetical protein
MRVRSSRGVASVAAGVLAFLSLLISANPAAAAEVTVTGAGSTWSQIAVDQWRSRIIGRSTVLSDLAGRLRSL